MKKKSQSLSRNFGPVKLYLTDIADLVAIIGDLPDCHVVVEAKGFEFDSLDELVQQGDKRLERIAITAFHENGLPEFRVVVARDDSAIHSFHDTNDHHGVLSRVERRVMMRQRVLKEMKLGSLIVGGLALLFGASFLSSGSRSTNPDSLLIAYVLLSIAGITAATYYFSLPWQRSEIYLEHRRALPSFWERNQDKILLAIVTSVLSIAGTLAVQAISLQLKP